MYNCGLCNLHLLTFGRWSRSCLGALKVGLHGRGDTHAGLHLQRREPLGCSAGHLHQGPYPTRQPITGPKIKLKSAPKRTPTRIKHHGFPGQCVPSIPACCADLVTLWPAAKQPTREPGLEPVLFITTLERPRCAIVHVKKAIRRRILGVRAIDLRERNPKTSLARLFSLHRHLTAKSRVTLHPQLVDSRCSRRPMTPQAQPITRSTTPNMA